MARKFYVVIYLNGAIFIDTKNPFNTDVLAQAWIDANAMMGAVYWIQEGQTK